MFQLKNSAGQYYHAHDTNQTTADGVFCTLADQPSAGTVTVSKAGKEARKLPNEGNTGAFAVAVPVHIGGEGYEILIDVMLSRGFASCADVFLCLNGEPLGRLDMLTISAKTAQRVCEIDLIVDDCEPIGEALPIEKAIAGVYALIDSEATGSGGDNEGFNTVIIPARIKVQAQAEAGQQGTEQAPEDDILRGELDRLKREYATDKGRDWRTDYNAFIQRLDLIAHKVADKLRA